MKGFKSRRVMEESEAPASSWWQDLILPAALAAIVAVVLLRRGDKRGKRVPPGPRPWPVFGNLLSLGKLLHQDMARLASRYGPVLLLRLGAVNLVVVSSAEMAEAVLKTHDRALASRPRTIGTYHLTYDNQTISFAPYGTYWRHVRKVFTLELFTARRMQQFRGVRAEEVVRAVRAVLAECKDGTSAVAVGDKFEELAWNVISRMLISKRFYEESDVRNVEYISVFKDLLSVNGRLPIGEFIPWLRKFDLGGIERDMADIRKRMDAMLDGVLEEHTRKMSAGGGRGDGTDDDMDMVDVLLTRPADGEPPLTINQVKGILTDGFVAGTDTASLTLAWATAELMRNPRVLERAQLELDEVVGHARLVTEADIPNLPYLRAIVKETFRLHPVVPILLPHEVDAECELGGYAVPVGTGVIVNAWAIGRAPALWERALEFWPERFLGGLSEVDVLGQHYALLPFGSGRRSCPGRPLGLITVQYGLAALLHACDLRLPQGTKPEDVDLSEGYGVTMPLATPLHLMATPRLPLPVIQPAL